MNLNIPIKEVTLVAFDTETSGAYPVGYDVVEFGAVKWSQGREVDRLQFLFRPREPMSDFIIGIHGITNEMVTEAPALVEKIQEISDFFKGSVAIAHHAPFDMGFMSLAFEQSRLALPSEPALCTSLLSRKLIHGAENHKLQTLVQYLKLSGGQAHRAYDDAFACLQVAQKCFDMMSSEVTLEDVIKSQGKSLWWKDFSLSHLSSQKWQALISAIKAHHDVDMVYRGGGKKGETRRVKPLGIVRNPDGDYLQAISHRENVSKRYYLSRIEDVAEVF